MPALLELVAASVPLKRRGRDHWGCCPFHSPDKTGSFKVGTYKGKERFYCFGCQARGDAADWLMLTRRIDYKAAKRILGEEVARPDPAIIAARREAEQRADRISAYRDRNPDCNCPPWLLAI